MPPRTTHSPRKLIGTRVPMSSSRRSGDESAVRYWTKRLIQQRKVLAQEQSSREQAERNAARSRQDLLDSMTEAERKSFLYCEQQDAEIEVLKARHIELQSLIEELRAEGEAIREKERRVRAEIAQMSGEPDSEE